jgi:hypothetical protein
LGLSAARRPSALCPQLFLKTTPLQFSLHNCDECRQQFGLPGEQTRNPGARDDHVDSVELAMST